MKYKTLFLVSLTALMAVLPSQVSALKKQYTVSGKTMGTYYKIKFITRDNQSQWLWGKRVEIRLKEVNRKMSMYDPKSELSVFNQSKINTPVKISPDFFTVIETSTELYNLTNGAWDGTIKPLVDLWGFGVKKSTHTIPSNKKIQTALSTTGYGHIKVTGIREITKEKSVTLDLGSIAKGYGVDAISDLFRSMGVHNFLVEIGGELYAAGKTIKRRYWKVGITKPDSEAAKQGIFQVVRLKDMAIATSGNYRNFFKINNQTYSHILNPKTGYPVKNKIVSASVISKDCTFADGLATALMVMDVDKGLELVNTLEGTECLIIQKIGHDLIRHTSTGFDAFLVK